MSRERKIEEMRTEIQLLEEMFERANSMFKRMAISGRVAALENKIRAAEEQK